MSKITLLKVFLVLQVLSPVIIVLALRVFGMPAEGAGALFILVGVAMLIPIVRWPKFKTLALFWVTALYVVVGCILYSERLTHWGNSYQTFSVLGLPASVFHHSTEVLYVFLIVLTSIELYKTRKSPATSTADF